MPPVKNRRHGGSRPRLLLVLLIAAILAAAGTWFAHDTGREHGGSDGVSQRAPVEETAAGAGPTPSAPVSPARVTEGPPASGVVAPVQGSAPALVSPPEPAWAKPPAEELVWGSISAVGAEMPVEGAALRVDYVWHKNAPTGTYRQHWVPPTRDGKDVGALFVRHAAGGYHVFSQSPAGDEVVRVRLSWQHAEETYEGTVNTKGLGVDRRRDLALNRKRRVIPLDIRFVWEGGAPADNSLGYHLQFVARGGGVKSPEPMPGMEARPEVHGFEEGGDYGVVNLENGYTTLEFAPIHVPERARSMEPVDVVIVKKPDLVVRALFDGVAPAGDAGHIEFVPLTNREYRHVSLSSPLKRVETSPGSGACFEAHFLSADIWSLANHRLAVNYALPGASEEEPSQACRQSFPLVLPGEARSQTIELTIRPPPEFEFRVVNADGEPVSGVQLGLDRNQRLLSTGDDGRAMLYGDPIDEPEIVVVLGPRAFTLPAPKAGASSMVIRLHPVVDLSFHFIDPAGNPVKGVEFVPLGRGVFWPAEDEKERASRQSNEAGEVSTRVRPPGTADGHGPLKLQYLVSHPNFARKEVEISIERGETRRRVTIKMVPVVFVRIVGSKTHRNLSGVGESPAVEGVDLPESEKFDVQISRRDDAGDSASDSLPPALTFALPVGATRLSFADRSLSISLPPIAPGATWEYQIPENNED